MRTYTGTALVVASEDPALPPVLGGHIHSQNKAIKNGATDTHNAEMHIIELYHALTIACIQGDVATAPSTTQVAAPPTL